MNHWRGKIQPQYGRLYEDIGHSEYLTMVSGQSTTATITTGCCFLVLC